MGTRKSISPALEARIISMYQTGEKIKHISNRTGIHYQRIKNLLMRRHIPLRVTHSEHTFTDTERAEIVLRYATTGLNKLASTYHVGQDAIIKILIEEGVTLRRSNEAPNMLSWKSCAAAHYRSIGLEHVAALYEEKVKSHV